MSSIICYPLFDILISPLIFCQGRSHYIFLIPFIHCLFDKHIKGLVTNYGERGGLQHSRWAM